MQLQCVAEKQNTISLRPHDNVVTHKSTYLIIAQIETINKDHSYV